MAPSPCRPTGYADPPSEDEPRLYEEHGRTPGRASYPTNSYKQIRAKDASTAASPPWRTAAASPPPPDLTVNSVTAGHHPAHRGQHGRHGRLQLQQQRHRQPGGRQQPPRRSAAGALRPGGSPADDRGRRPGRPGQ